MSEGNSSTIVQLLFGSTNLLSSRRDETLKGSLWPKARTTTKWLLAKPERDPSGTYNVSVRQAAQAQWPAFRALVSLSFAGTADDFKVLSTNLTSSAWGKGGPSSTIRNFRFNAKSGETSCSPSTISHSGSWWEEAESVTMASANLSTLKLSACSSCLINSNSLATDSLVFRVLMQVSPQTKGKMFSGSRKSASWRHLEWMQRAKENPTGSKSTKGNSNRQTSEKSKQEWNEGGRATVVWAGEWAGSDCKKIQHLQNPIHESWEENTKRHSEILKAYSVYRYNWYNNNNNNKNIYIYIRYSAYMCQAQTGKLDLTSAAAALHRFEVLAYLLQMSFSHTWKTYVCCLFCHSLYPHAILRSENKLRTLV